jgi:hypothetical protein
LRSENAGEKSEFYIIIEGDNPSIFRKRVQSFSVEIFPFQRFKANLAFIYSEVNLKDYNDYIERYSLYFKNYARAFLTEFERITYTVIFTEDIL